MSDTSAEQVTADRAAFAAIETAATAAWNSADAWLTANGPAVPPVNPPVPGNPVPSLPAGVAVGALLLNEPFTGPLNTELWTDHLTWIENNVKTDPKNVIVNNGLTLKLSSTTDGATITSQGKQSYKTFYAEFVATLQASPDGGMANSVSPMWFDTADWSLEFDCFESLNTGGKGPGRPTFTIHKNKNAQQTSWVLPGTWTGKPIKCGVYFKATELDLYVVDDPTGTLVLVHTFTEADGYAVPDTGIFPVATIGCNAPGSSWWGETVVPGEVQTAHLYIWDAA
jgi:hypothetical protein